MFLEWEEGSSLRIGFEERGGGRRNSVNCAEVLEGCRKEVDREDAKSSRAGSLKVSFSVKYT